MPMRPILTRLIAVVFVSFPIVLAWGADAASGRRAAQEALKPYGSLVGEWRGAGQVERGRSRGAWTETASWAWKLTKNTAALEMKITKGGKYLKSAVLRPGPEPKTYVLDAVLFDGTNRTFTGKGADQKPLVLTASGTGDEGVRRITLTPLHDTRLLLRLEGQYPDKSYSQLGEVGYTREGVAFAVGESGPVCIVTEGRGTLLVSYKGKTYHVCCTGCRELFQENPEAILAEAAEREKAKEKK
jgi:YHS domain-containing protein